MKLRIVDTSDKPKQFETQIVNIGVSSSALFDTREADEVFRKDGEAAYMDYMNARVDTPFMPGAAFPFVQKMLALNSSNTVIVNISLLSRNNPFSAIRINKSIEANDLTFKDSGLRQISGEAYTRGKPITPKMLEGFGIDLLLSTNEEDVVSALEAGIPAALVSTKPLILDGKANENMICFAFDFDRVIGVAYGKEDDEYPFDSERYFREFGLDAYYSHENNLAHVPAEPGPLAPFFQKIVNLHDAVNANDDIPMKIEMYIVTARAASALPRVLNTLNHWQQETTGLVSCGSVAKAPQIENLKADIFFDDSERHIANLPQGTLGALVPWTGDVPKRPLALGAPKDPGGPQIN